MGGGESNKIGGGGGVGNRTVTKGGQVGKRHKYSEKAWGSVIRVHTRGKREGNKDKKSKVEWASKTTGTD